MGLYSKWGAPKREYSELDSYTLEQKQSELERVSSKHTNHNDECSTLYFLVLDLCLALKVEATIINMRKLRHFVYAQKHMSFTETDEQMEFYLQSNIKMYKFLLNIDRE